MPYEKKERMITDFFLGLFLLAIGIHYAFAPWAFYAAVPSDEAMLRNKLVRHAESWLGLQEADGSHTKVLDVYNSHEPLALGYVVQDTDSWCAAFVSAAAIETGLTDIIPTECGCERQIALFQALGQWEENDNAVPQPGDLIYYDWDQKTPGEATGWSDHVGIVTGIKWPMIKVIEGNKDDAVGYRILPIGHKSIRGYAKPDYLTVLP